MIGCLEGVLLQKKPPLLLIKVGGVGYEVFSPMSTFYHLPDLENVVTLLTHLVVREEGQALYGFLKEEERELFRALIKVSGVGPKMALSILSSLSPTDFLQCIESGDTARLTGIPGVGKKTRERLALELRHTAAQWKKRSPDGMVHSPDLEEAMSALTALGYKASAARRELTRLYKPGMSSESLIRLTLRQMVNE